MFICINMNGGKRIYFNDAGVADVSVVLHLRKPCISYLFILYYSRKFPPIQLQRLMEVNDFIQQTCNKNIQSIQRTLQRIHLDISVGTLTKILQ